MPVCVLLFLSLGLAREGGAEEPPPWIEMGRGVPQFLETVSKKKKARVAFLGGSITQNAKGHTAMVPQWLQKSFPDCDFDFVNAGLSSTCSVTGAFRLRDHLLKKGPIDLLIVEFAVNDDQDASHDRRTAIRGLEGIIRQFRKVNPGGDIISIQFVNPHILKQAQAGAAAVSVKAHKDVARHYGVPIVDVGLALADAVEKGTNDWQKYGGVHPKEEGYRFVTDLIVSVIRDSHAELGAEPANEVAALDPSNFENTLWIDTREASWLGGWRFGNPSRKLLPLGGIRKDYEPYGLLRGNEPGTMLYLDFTGKTLCAFILAGPDAGILEVSVDSGAWRQIDFYHRHSKNLNYPRTVILADNLALGRHQAAIRISQKKNRESKGTAASILYFGSN